MGGGGGGKGKNTQNRVVTKALESVRQMVREN